MTSAKLVFVAALAVCAILPFATADSCVKVKKGDLPFCYMVDYPVFLANTLTLEEADEQAEFQYEHYVDSDVLFDESFVRSVDCANAVRAFRCSWVMHRCSDDGKQPLGPCKQTCEKFFDVCYGDPVLRKEMKSKTCMYLPTKGCTKVPIPPGSAPAFDGDKPPKGGRGLESVIYKDNFKIPIVGDVTFGVKNLTILAVEGNVELKTKGKNLGLRAKDVSFEAEIQYFFIQHRFPWIKSSGSIRTNEGSGLLNIDTRFEFDKVEHKFKYHKVDVKLESEFGIFRTGFSWIKKYWVNYFKAFILEQIEGPIRESVQDFITKIIPTNFGWFFQQAPFSQGDVTSKVSYRRNIYEGAE